MNKPKGAQCPTCYKTGRCSHWCDTCGEHLNYPDFRPDTGTPNVGKSGRRQPYDDYGILHHCFEGKGGRKGEGFIKDGIIETTMAQDLHEYMRRHAKLEGKDWILYVDDNRTGFVIDREKEVIQ